MNPGFQFSLRNWLNTKLVIGGSAAVSLFAGYLVYHELDAGAAGLNGEGGYLRSQEPLAYWFFVGFHVLVTVSFLIGTIQTARGKIDLASDGDGAVAAEPDATNGPESKPTAAGAKSKAPGDSVPPERGPT